MNQKEKEKLVILIDTSGKNVIMAQKINSNSEAELEKERNRLRVREWRKNNPDKYKKHLEYVREWKRNNKEKLKEYRKNYYQKNKDKYRERYTKSDRNTIRSKRKNAGK